MSIVASELRSQGIRQASLPKWAPAAATVGAVLVTLLLFATTGFQGDADFLVVAVVLSVVAVAGLSWRVEGRRRAVDRIATNVALVALLLTILPLGFVIGYVVKRGHTAFGWSFLTHDLSTTGPLQAGGGVGHAIVGTVEQVLLASVISVPLGIMVAIFITEYGGRRLGTAVRFLIDVMTGIPSIVAGLFVLSFWIFVLHQGFSGIAGAIALAIIELPIIVRTSEEMIKLVPGALREASYALGIPKWRTILRVVLPTASTGITTGVMLAIARVIGETAPVLLVVGSSNYFHNDPFTGSQGSIGVYIFQNATSPSDFSIQRAWAAAMTLILIVLVLYVAARLLTRRNRLAGR
ncbi:MAG TPA: phosphate ABC transporter permease PstA [Mycobacteriales bacterium]|nr:phosphate ABC transporter permease PstA [Mycobacteriales bacterium]